MNSKTNNTAAAGVRSGHSAERLADFAARGADDDPSVWMPLWVQRDLVLKCLGESESGQGDDELNEAFHEWMEHEVGR